MGSGQKSGGRFNLLQVFSPQPASTFMHRLVADGHVTVQCYDVSTRARVCRVPKPLRFTLAHGMTATRWAVGDGRDAPQGCSGYAHTTLGCATPPPAPC